jgi:hypothetical protein
MRKPGALTIHRKSRQLLLNRINNFKYWIHLLSNFSHASSTVLVKIIPVLLQNLLHLSQQIQSLFNDVVWKIGVWVSWEWILVSYRMLETALGFIVCAKFLLNEAVRTILWRGLIKRVLVTEMFGWWRLVLFIGEHIIWLKLLIISC